MPLWAIDPDGKDIIIVTEHGAVKLGIETLMRTETGKALWEKYGKSTTDDIYITSQVFVKQTDANAATYKNIEKTFVTDNKISLDMEKDAYQKDFAKLNGMDVSRSAGRKIHLISFNEDLGTTMDNSIESFSKYKAAFSVFHEMKAHIDLLKDQIANAVTEHEALGCTDNPFNTGAAWPREGSPADALNLELLDLINKDSKSSIELKPKGTEDAKKSDKSKTIEPPKKDDK